MSNVSDIRLVLSPSTFIKMDTDRIQRIDSFRLELKQSVNYLIKRKYILIVG